MQLILQLQVCVVHSVDLKLMKPQLVILLMAGLLVAVGRGVDQS
jgi:hypothetical protein